MKSALPKLTPRFARSRPIRKKSTHTPGSATTRWFEGAQPDMSNLRLARDSSNKVKQTCTETNENCKCTPRSSGSYQSLETSGNCLQPPLFRGRTGWGSRLTDCKLLPSATVRPVKRPKPGFYKGPRGGPTRGPREVARGPREVVVRSYTSKSFSLACKSHHPGLGLR